MCVEQGCWDIFFASPPHLSAQGVLNFGPLFRALKGARFLCGTMVCHKVVHFFGFHFGGVTALNFGVRPHIAQPEQSRCGHFCVDAPYAFASAQAVVPTLMVYMCALVPILTAVAMHGLLRWVFGFLDQMALMSANPFFYSSVLLFFLTNFYLVCA